VIDGVGSNFTIVYEDDSVDPDAPPDSGDSGDDDGSSGRQNSAPAFALLAAVSSVAALFW
jgi:hypothetical protein